MKLIRGSKKPTSIVASLSFPEKKAWRSIRQ